MSSGCWMAYGAAALLIAAATVAARLSPGLVVRRTLLGLPFLLAAVTVLFTVPGRALWFRLCGHQAPSSSPLRNATAPAIFPSSPPAVM